MLITFGRLDHPVCSAKEASRYFSLGRSHPSSRGGEWLAPCFSLGDSLMLIAALFACAFVSSAYAQQRAPRPPRPGVNDPGTQRPMSTITPMAVFPVEGTPDWQVLTVRSIQKDAVGER